MTTQAQPDFSQMMRGTIGFDQIAELIGKTLTADTRPANYPPYNIEKTDEDRYRVTLAVAGFTEAEITIEQSGNTLEVAGRQDEPDESRSFLHRGIATRAFKRQFTLADHVKVEEARLENGLLHVDLRREVPEERRPRKIEIST